MINVYELLAMFSSLCKFFEALDFQEDCLLVNRCDKMEPISGVYFYNGINLYEDRWL